LADLCSISAEDVSEVGDVAVESVGVGENECV
jgi:hypothetical protein